jgi:ubiquinone/menaquinone biosynthesis C-methylase UbiE
MTRRAAPATKASRSDRGLETSRPGADAPAAVAPRDAYDAFADRYDRWEWQTFWHHNEGPQIASLVATARRSARVLDVGVGTGFYLSGLAKPGRLACGIDISEGMLRIAQRRLGAWAALVQGDALAMPFADGGFDVVLLNRVATHLPELSPLAAELARVLGGTGRLVVSDVAPEHPYACTELGLEGRTIPVTTYKHTIGEWQRSATRPASAFPNRTRSPPPTLRGCQPRG